MKLLMITEVFLLFALHYGNSLQAIPEAPILPDLDYSSLPEFVRKYLPTEQTISRSNSVYDDIPKTYGMSIKNDNGVVWNDLSSKSRYQVGNSQNSKSGREIDDIVDDMINEIYNHPSTHKSKQPNTTPTSVTEMTVVNTTTGHYVNQNEGNISNTDPKFNGEQNVNAVSPTVVKNTTSNDIDQSITNPMGATSVDKMTVKEELNEIEKKLDAMIMNISQSMKFPKSTGSLDEHSNASMNQEKNNQDHKAAPSTLELLLQDDEIWTWLSSTISKYLEILMNRMGTLVKEEVDELIKSYFETHQCGSCSNNDTNVKFVNNENPEDLSKKHKETQPETENKDKFGNKYENSTIYGNSVGNERVTNVFIFHMNGKNNGEPIITANNSSGSYNIDYNNNTTTDNEDKNEKDIKATTESTINTDNDTDADDSDKDAKEVTKHKGKHSDSKDSKKPKESESEDEEKGSVAKDSKKSKNTKKDSDSKKSNLNDKDDEKDSDAKDTKKSKGNKKDKDNGTKDNKKSKEKVSDAKDTKESKESGEDEEKESDSKESKKTEKEKDSDSKDTKKTKGSAEDEDNDKKETKKGKKNKDSDAEDSKELKESEEDEEKDSDAKDSKKSKKSKKEKESEDDEVKDSDDKDTKKTKNSKKDKDSDSKDTEKTKKGKKDKDVTDKDASVEKSTSKEDDSGKDSAETTTEVSKKDGDSGSSSHEDD